MALAPLEGISRFEVCMRRSHVLFTTCTAIAVSLPAFAAHAQRAGAPLPQPRVTQPAVVVPRPTPVGGLATRPLSAPDARGRSSSRPLRPAPPYRPARYGVYPLAVVDAPYPRAGVAVVNGAPQHAAVAQQSVAYGRLWVPTVEQPRWRIDSSVTPVQAWRDLIVTDVVCDIDGNCVQRERSTRAPWVATCRCYAFRDAIGRPWRVE